MLGHIGIGELLVIAMIVGLPVIVLAVVFVALRSSRSASPLLPCRSCGLMISPRALSCPRCGA